MDNKIIFLDFDGCLNNSKYIADYLDTFKQPSEKTYYITEHIDPECVQRVNEIISKTGAKVVLSTAWRKAFDVDRLIEILQSKGFIGEIIGETPVFEKKPRWTEIKAWMDNNNVHESQIVILDDMSDMGPLNHRFVKTNFDFGIKVSHVNMAIDLLTE